MENAAERPIIGITMGDPVGIGPELICRALLDPDIFHYCRPLVIGDAGIIESARRVVHSGQALAVVDSPDAGAYEPGRIDLYSISNLDPSSIQWGSPTALTGRSMIDYITTGIDMAMTGEIAALVTCPINKTAMKLAASRFHGHTELLAHRTGASRYAMMMAGQRLRVVLVTIHTPLRQVPAQLSQEGVWETIQITHRALKESFGIDRPQIAVAGLNPHAGEGDMFGDEESRVIAPAVLQAVAAGMDVAGPFPPDTIFYHAVDGPYDAVVCMYHDQGLIPFKMIHFSDGVNTTLGLPIVRTSVDHGTAYDIAGKGVADHGSLTAAIALAREQAVNRLHRVPAST